MFEEIFLSLGTFNPYLIYAVLLVIPFIENIFPPSPSDLIVVLGGSLIVQGTIHFIPALIVTTIGSELGFLLLYYFGMQTDKKLVRKGKLKFIPIESLETAEKWFAKYGFFIILFNRFISGIRSIISFFAGLSELEFYRTLTLSTISALLWNIILLTLGIIFGENIALADNAMNTYSSIIFIVLTGMSLFFVIKFFWKKKRADA
ncbi:MAG: DedA family protein [Ignavibacteriaceae bacterium]|nr:DedA family protein [Ignavibacteriaceae bacterium]HRI45934.1 DedA family protein [Ignavibacteriaceae bacterium]